MTVPNNGTLALRAVILNLPASGPQAVVGKRLRTALLTNGAILDRGLLLLFAPMRGAS